MKDEEKHDEEEQRNELVPVAEYEVLDKFDDQAIIEMMTGQAIQDYVYSFKQGSRQVEGLTLAGINEAANRRGGIEVEDIQFEEKDDSWIAIVKATDTFTGSSRYGAFEQPKKSGNRDDPFAFTKAIHKAQRNAVKQLLPVPILKEILNYYLHGKKPTSSGAQRTLPIDVERAVGDRESDAQKAAFVVATKLRERLEQQGISQTDFWGYVKRRYSVDSRDNMTETQWTQLSKELSLAERNPEDFQELITRVRKFEAAHADMEVIEGEVVEEEEPEESAPETEQKSEAPRDALF